MNNINSKKGQIILIALLVMAVVLVVSLAIGTLMVRELKMSANIDRSVTAYFAAESGIESALWEARKTSDHEVVTSRGNILGGPPPGPGGEWELKPFPPDEVLVDITQLEKDKPIQVKLKKEAYSIIFSGLDGREKILLSLISWPDGATFDPSKIEKGEGQVMPGFLTYSISDKLKCCTATPCLADHAGCDDFILRLKAIDVNPTEDPYASITDIDVKDGNGDLISDALTSNKLKIKSTGDYHRTKRTLQAIVYKQPPLHGIFDYVLFSDESIIK